MFFLTLITLGAVLGRSMTLLGIMEQTLNQKKINVFRQNNFVGNSNKWETGREHLSVLLWVIKQIFLSHPGPESRSEKVL